MLQHAGRWFLTGATALFISSAGAQPSPERLAPCAACHGADGNSAVAGVPSLAGQPKIFLENYLVLVREGLRGNDAMRELLRGVKDPEIIALANHYTALAPKPQPGAADAALMKRGRQVAQKNRCGTCHLPDFRGREQMPRLAGQREDFLYDIMVAYQKNKRAGGDTMMSAALYGIPDADLKALAHFLAHSK
jgi:cytochrome c553